MSQIDMSPNQMPVDLDDDDSVIRYVQKVRHRIVDELITGDLPADARDREFLATVARDLATTAMAKKKLGASERQSNKDREAAVLIEAMRQQMGSQSPFLAKEGQVEREIPRLEGEAPKAFPDTMKERGISNERYDEFQSRMDPLMEAVRKEEEQQYGGEA